MDETGSDCCPVAGTSCDFPTRVLVLLVPRSMRFSGRGPCGLHNFEGDGMQPSEYFLKFLSSYQGISWTMVARLL